MGIEHAIQDLLTSSALGGWAIVAGQALIGGYIAWRLQGIGRRRI